MVACLATGLKCFGLHKRGGELTMNPVTKDILSTFAAEYGLRQKGQDKRFEHLSAYLTLKKHHRQEFKTGDIVTPDGDGGLDSIAILVNDYLFPSGSNDFKNFIQSHRTLDVTYIFVQATTATSFNLSKAERFTNAVKRFFQKGVQVGQEQLKKFSEIKDAISLAKCINHKPHCFLYYVYDGIDNVAREPEAHRSEVIAALTQTNMFGTVDYQFLDSDKIYKYWQNANFAVTKNIQLRGAFQLDRTTDVPRAFLGAMQVNEFIEFITTDKTFETLIPGLFEANVRDFLPKSNINAAIKESLLNDGKHFVLKNNGITIIAAEIKDVGQSDYQINDFFIVNGCQTSKAIHQMRREINAVDNTGNSIRNPSEIFVPVRFIQTNDEEVITEIIKSTNRQNPIKPTQLLALLDYAKNKLEPYFKSNADPKKKLYYERRDGQYEAINDKTRICKRDDVIRAFASMFGLPVQPHAVTKNFSNITKGIGTKIYHEKDNPIIYYTSAYALFRAQEQFRLDNIEGKAEVAIWHILLTMRYMYNLRFPQNIIGEDVARYCTGLLEILWNETKAKDHVLKAAELVCKCIEGLPQYDRDLIRVESFTKAVQDECEKSGYRTWEGRFIKGYNK